LDNLTNLTHLTFGWEFNKPLTNSLGNLSQLKYLELVSFNYNHQIELPSNIKILSLNSNNISLIDNLHNSIEELNLGKQFNLPLDNLQSSIKSIKFDKQSEYNKPLTNLPCLLEILELPDDYTIPVMNIGSQCEIIAKK
jgi:hypothetical protein